MSATRKKLICLYDGTHITLQRAEYIEDGPYIGEFDGLWYVMEIPQYGGEPRLEGSFDTLQEALEWYDRIAENYT